MREVVFFVVLGLIVGAAVVLILAWIIFMAFSIGMKCPVLAVVGVVVHSANCGRVGKRVLLLSGGTAVCGVVVSLHIIVDPLIALRGSVRVSHMPGFLFATW